MAVLIPKKNTRAGQQKEREDREAAQRRFRQRKSFFITELMRQQANRYQMALDESYYDGDQWTPDEAAVVRARGQNPVVFNECAPMVDFLLGTERRMRVDFTVQNRSDGTEEAFQDATNKQHLLKFVDDLNRTQFVRSDAADDKFKAGLGWIEVGVRADPTDYPIYKRRESWRNMLYDSLGQSKMPEDWRYIFRFREVDFDIAEAMIPADQREKVDNLRRAIINADTRAHMDWLNGPMSGLGLNSMMGDAAMMDKWTTYDAEAWLSNPRERVLLIEAWTTEPFRDTTGEGFGMEDRLRMRKRAAVMTEHDTIFEAWSPYEHDQYPFIPEWCYRRKKDGAPYGVIRRLRGPQDSLNKHMSKAQFRISTRQVWLEEGALNEELMDADELEDAAGDPAAVLHFARGAVGRQGADPRRCSVGPGRHPVGRALRRQHPLQRPGQHRGPRPRPAGGQRQGPGHPRGTVIAPGGRTVRQLAAGAPVGRRNHPLPVRAVPHRTHHVPQARRQPACRVHQPEPARPDEPASGSTTSPSARRHS